MHIECHDELNKCPTLGCATPLKTRNTGGSLPTQLEAGEVRMAERRSEPDTTFEEINERLDELRGREPEALPLAAIMIVGILIAITILFFGLVL